MAAAGRGGGRGAAAHGGRGARGRGGDEAHAPAELEGRGPAEALALGPRAGGAAGGGSGLTVAPGHLTVIREDAQAWFEFEGNPNIIGESSSSHKDRPVVNKHHKLPNPLPGVIRKGPNFLPFNELEAFENSTGAQTPQIDEMNEDLVIIFESISVVRKNIYQMMCSVAEANDPASRGKAVGDEVKKANNLLKKAQEKVTAVEALGGRAVPIPHHFHLDVKSMKR